VSKKLSTRIVHKHDLEANWLKATNFVPLQGELIIYDIEVDADGNTLELPEGRTEPYTYERSKIGDGKTVVSALPFSTTTPDWNQNDSAAVDYIKNRTHWVEEAADDTIYHTLDERFIPETIARASAYYTKSEIDNLELITVDDIDTICGGSIQYAEDVTF
jgi:hypothetical protein